MRPSPWWIVLLLGALVGFAFAAVSTYDFVAHLDREVHGVHCSFLPGVGGTDVSGDSGCHVTLMSPFSSIMRDTVWGGVPVSLPAMGVFAFLAFAAVWLLVSRRQGDPRATLFLMLATLVPVAASVAMGYIALSGLGAACKLCIGIYVSSGLAFVGALGLWLQARSNADPSASSEVSWPLVAAAVGLGIVFTLLPAGVYAAAAPDYTRYVGACGTLSNPEDPYGVLVPLGPQGHAVPVIEVLDPLCPACRAFERRFETLEVASEVRRKVALFPLDSECNWMVDRSIHPGACAVTEAMLCAGPMAQDVLDWAFEEQEAILEAAKRDPEAAKRMVSAQFPTLADCIGTPKTQARLNQALRWAVDNQLPVLTPQVYVGDQRVCDEDTDLGLDYVVSRLVERTPPSSPGSAERKPLPAPPAQPQPSPAAGAGSADGAAAEPGDSEPSAEGEEPSDEAAADEEDGEAAADEEDGDPAPAEPAEPSADEAEPEPSADEAEPEPSTDDTEPDPSADDVEPAPEPTDPG